MLLHRLGEAIDEIGDVVSGVGLAFGVSGVVVGDAPTSRIGLDVFEMRGELSPGDVVGLERH